MNPRTKTSVRWLLPGIIFVFVCAGLTIVILKRYSSDSQPRAATPREVESQKALPLSGANGSSTNLAVTNQPGAEAQEDRVVLLITEGNQLLAQGNHAEAAHKYEPCLSGWLTNEK